MFVSRHSGVVIAGFGTSEMFPKIASYIAECVVDDKVKKKFLAGKSNTQHDEFFTTIIPFAQDEMVWTFIDGIDPQIADFARTYLADMLDKYSASLTGETLGVADDVSQVVKNRLMQDGNQLLNQFHQDLNRFRDINYRQPILDLVGVLPKDELAAMAESLVNLTVFKRKVSQWVETVGGPIDVAVISKGDGFVWVKRKHYFKAELNQHFFANYFQQVSSDDQ